MLLLALAATVRAMVLRSAAEVCRLATFPFARSERARSYPTRAAARRRDGSRLRFRVTLCSALHTRDDVVAPKHV